MKSERKRVGLPTDAAEARTGHPSRAMARTLVTPVVDRKGPPSPAADASKRVAESLLGRGGARESQPGRKGPGRAQKDGEYITTGQGEGRTGSGRGGEVDRVLSGTGLDFHPSWTDASYRAHDIRTRPNFMSITARPADAHSGSPSRTKFRMGRNFVRSVSCGTRCSGVERITMSHAVRPASTCRFGLRPGSSPGTRAEPVLRREFHPAGRFPDRPAPASAPVPLRRARAMKSQSGEDSASAPPRTYNKHEEERPHEKCHMDFAHQFRLRLDHARTSLHEA